MKNIIFTTLIALSVNAMAVTEITKDNVKTIMDHIKTSNKIAIIDSYLPTCEPCKLMAPMLDQLEVKFGDKYEFYRANVQNVQINHPPAVPTIILIQKGHLLGEPIVGAPGSVEQLEQAILSQVNYGG